MTSRSCPSAFSQRASIPSAWKNEIFLAATYTQKNPAQKKKNNWALLEMRVRVDKRVELFFPTRQSWMPQMTSPSLASFPSPLPDSLLYNNLFSTRTKARRMAITKIRIFFNGGHRRGDLRWTRVKTNKRIIMYPNIITNKWSYT